MKPILLRTARWFAFGLATLLVAGVFALACTFVYLAPSLPTAETMSRVQLAVPLRVYTDSGALISQIGEQRRIPVQFEDIPLLVRQAVLAAEDDRFFEHSGLDWMGVSRAMWKVAVSGGAAQGGSTISQQAARNMFLSLDKTLRRKLAEIFVTWRMERDFTKEQILATYLNVILFGQRSYGVAAAAQTYYGKNLDELTVAQAATLAGIIQRPSRQNPIYDPKAAEQRRSYVLRRMRELGYIDAATAAAAAREPVLTRAAGSSNEVDAQYVAELARLYVIEHYGEAAINAGMKVYTTVDGRLQTAANRALRLEVINYDRRHGYRGHLGTVQIPASADEDQLDELLGKFRSVVFLKPAVVTAVAATTAEVHVRGIGKTTIPWAGMSWARKVVKNGLAASPRKASDVLKRGDVVYVITDERGTGELAQMPVAQGAVVSLDPYDGAIKVMVGGFDFFSNQYNRVTTARRQPGSGFKPFLYSAALENGFTPATMICDCPVLVDPRATEEKWDPGNSDGEFLGAMRLRQALVRSRNPATIRLLQSVGIDTFVSHATKFGFDPDDMPRNLTLALGSLTVTPLQMARGFSAFANGGFRVEPYFIRRIEDADGKMVFETEPLIACPECERPAASPSPLLQVATTAAPEGAGITALPAGTVAIADPTATPAVLANDPVMPELSVPVGPPPRGLDDVPPWMREAASVQGGRGFLPEKRLAPRVISPQNAWLMSDILHDATTVGTAARTTAQLGRNDLHGKTGTTNGPRDNWFNGFTRHLVTSVWFGRDDYQLLGDREFGNTTAVPMWILYMREALRGVPQERLPRPSGLVDIPVSPGTGERTSEFDPDAIIETFMLNALPPDSSSGYDYFPPGTPGAGTPPSNAPLF